MHEQNNNLTNKKQKKSKINKVKSKRMNKFKNE